jgi:hypothetical protein
MSRPPSTECAHRFDQFLTCRGQGVGHLGRPSMLNRAMDDAVGFELAQLGGQNFFGPNPRCQIASTFHLPLTQLIVPDTGQP